jgi:hypothetical protein
MESAWGGQINISHHCTSPPRPLHFSHALFFTSLFSNDLLPFHFPMLSFTSLISHALFPFHFPMLSFTSLFSHALLPFHFQMLSILPHFSPMLSFLSIFPCSLFYLTFLPCSPSFTFLPGSLFYLTFLPYSPSFPFPMLSFLPHCCPMLSFLSIFQCSLFYLTFLQCSPAFPFSHALLFVTFLPSLLHHLHTLSFTSSVPICSILLMLSFTLCFSYVYLPRTLPLPYLPLNSHSSSPLFHLPLSPSLVFCKCALFFPC